MATVVLATAYGGPEVLSAVEQLVPEPGPGQVRIAVRAVGTNPADYKSYSGVWGSDAARLPLRVGLEAAGVVNAVGADAPFALGEEVIAYPANGTYASEVVVDAEGVVPKPATVDWDEAAGLLLTGATAVHLLDVLDLHSGDTVLLHGGAGGVGLMAVQLAALRGARVIATASPGNHGLLRELGAEPVAYGEGLAGRVRALAPDGVDAAGDMVGTDEALDVSLQLVRDRSRIATVANFTRAPTEGVQALGGMDEEGRRIRRAARAQLTQLAAEGKLRVIVAARYPLAEAAEANRRLKDGHTVGKIVLIP